MTRRIVYLILALSLSWATPAGQKAEKSITLPADNPLGELKAGRGVEVVRASCIACHSTDYIVRQPPSDAKRWGAEVRKMMTVFGAPIRESDAKVIVEYLASTYGPAAEAPRPTNKIPTAGTRKR